MWIKFIQILLLVRKVWSLRLNEVFQLSSFLLLERKVVSRSVCLIEIPIILRSPLTNLPLNWCWIYFSFGIWSVGLPSMNWGWIYFYTLNWGWIYFYTLNWCWIYFSFGIWSVGLPSMNWDWIHFYTLNWALIYFYILNWCWIYFYTLNWVEFTFILWIGR